MAIELYNTNWKHMFNKLAFAKKSEKLIDLIIGVPDTVFLFIAIASFYFLVWIINPGNYPILALFFVFWYVINLRLKNFKLSLLITFLVSTLIQTGKTYSIPIIPPSFFDPTLYPDGYQLRVVIEPTHVLGTLMLILLLRSVVKKEINVKKIIYSPMVLIFVGYLWNLMADYLGSSIPINSMTLTFLSFPAMVGFYFILAFRKRFVRLLPFVVAVFASFIFFESAISVQQYILKSSVGKNIEYTKGIEIPGRAIDEGNFTYRPDGTFDHANTLGMSLVYWMIIVVCAVLGRSVRKENVIDINYLFRKFKGRPLGKNGYIDLAILVLPLILGVSTLVITLSRSAWLGFVLAILVVLYQLEKRYKYKILLYSNKKILAICGISVLLFSYFFILPRAQKSVYSFTEGGGNFRWDQAQATWQIIINNPIFGVGSGMLPKVGLEFLPNSIFAKEPLDIHIWYFSAAADHGVLSIILFLLFVLLSVKIIYNSLGMRKLPANLVSFLKVGFLGLVVSFFVISLFSANSGGGNIMFLTALLYDKS
jgi:hypothetical protein